LGGGRGGKGGGGWGDTSFFPTRGLNLVGERGKKSKGKKNFFSSKRRGRGGGKEKGGGGDFLLCLKSIKGQALGSLLRTLKRGGGKRKKKKGKKKFIHLGKKGQNYFKSSEGKKGIKKKSRTLIREKGKRRRRSRSKGTKLKKGGKSSFPRCRKRGEKEKPHRKKGEGKTLHFWFFKKTETSRLGSNQRKKEGEHALQAGKREGGGKKNGGKKRASSGKDF